MKHIILTFTILFTAFLAKGQEERGNFSRLKHRPVQISLVHPIGTNGFYSGQFVNHLSFNIIAGYNGALQGLEFGGFANGIRYNASGLQFAGFGNFVGRDVNGGQFAGFINVAGKDVRAIQASGFMNIAGGKLQGGQFAGFLNIARQASGIQASGFLNVAGTLKGVQLGIVNFADSVSGGIPIGLFSFVRKGGFRALEFETNDVFRGSAIVKLGVPRFYNIIAVGVNPLGDEMTWGYGYGIGSQILKIGPVSANLDAVSYHINQGEWWTDDLNLLNRVSGNVTFKLSKFLSIYGGLAVNVLVSEYDDLPGNSPSIFGSRMFYEYDNGRTHVAIYPGFQAGIRL